MRNIFIFLFVFSISAEESTSLLDHLTDINNDLEAGKSIEPERWSYLNVNCMGLFRTIFDYSDEEVQKEIYEKLQILGATLTMVDKRFQDIPASPQGGNAIFEIYKPFYDWYRQESEKQFALDKSYFSPKMMIDASICRQYIDTLVEGLPDKGILNK